jgi:hypothetical protein
MRTLLKIVGGGWAALGLANIVASPAATPERQTMFAFVMIFNFVLFILPGLALFGIGAMMKRNQEGGKSVPDQNPTA